MRSKSESMGKQPPVEVKELRVVCQPCRKVLAWPLHGWQFRVIGLIQFKCRSCGQVISFPAEEVWGLAEKQDVENMAARLLFNEDKNEGDNKQD